MKPALKMETKQNIAMKMEAGEMATKKPMTKWKIAAILCVVISLLIAGAAILGVYAGKGMKDDTHKESWVIFRDTKTDTVIKERFIVQDMEVSIIRPGEMSVILDYGKNHVVLQRDGMKVNGTEDCLCTVFDLDTLITASLEDFNGFLNQTYVEVTKDISMDHMTLEPTGQDVDPNNLSRKSLEMCLGCQIKKANVKLPSDRQSIRSKRQWYYCGYRSYGYGYSCWYFYRCYCFY